MAQRRIVIGAIGGDRHKDAAMVLGKAVAEHGCILLTGGKLRESGEVKDAAMYGASIAEATGAAARLVGILPSEKNKELWVATSRRLFLDTGLEHNVRNVINGLTPDALVVFGGGRGTLAETAFAVAANKPMFFCDLPASRDRLIKNFSKYFVDGENSSTDVDLYLRSPLQAYHDAWKRSLSVDDLKSGLDNFLKTAPTAIAPDELVKACIAAAKDAARGPTGFPGLPDHPETKPLFEAVIKRISSPLD
ncbi:hypothetical protein [Bradyrhizobium sp. JYMT SZCCT0180]|uniref:SLOG cluster 4 domain-containing protein n=1 Tax=Bradyrhizobium sp. JYMT SZCCT0180 TaxID=2807666 RepID=UPI001BADB9C7|nr:hypothetical protein [Bradyrhizobium sp. JYMT SZCCT0180]MBR1214657.1 hypothetical protein [Bradyrhizobium sp. JYMT SZCCT0180]